MPTINILDKQTRELIAAGEVVERPASAIKELVENSIDAGATHITVEIENGGISLMRITDDGCGIGRDDVEKAFLRHATSKIKTDSDLECIGTLGFRGEALAAISAVSKVSMVTKTDEEEVGTHYVIEGGEKVLLDDVGCPTGTVIEVRDLFFNTPARMKFLKKDTKEGSNVAAVIDRIALSHPEISFEFIKDGKHTLNTTGNGNLKDAVYEVLGRDIALGTIPIDYELAGVRVHGLICKPFKCRPNRNLQIVFLNGRFVKSSTAMAALDVGYKNSTMVGKFPYCVINIEMPKSSVDVNVHPAKTEVRFEDESRVFNAIHYGVKNALENDGSRPEISFEKTQNIKEKSAQFLEIIADDVKQDLKLNIPQNNPTKCEPEIKTEKWEKVDAKSQENPFYNVNFFKNAEMSDNLNILTSKPKVDIDIVRDETEEKPTQPAVCEQTIESETLEVTPARFIGEVFKTYILAEQNDKLLLIDKHACHERILFEKLKANIEVHGQLLLTPISITLPKAEHSVIIENLSKLSDAGFDIDDFGDGTVILRAVPSMLADEDYTSLLSEIAENLSKTNSVMVEKLDRIYHTVACKAAVKAGQFSSEVQLIELMNEALFNNKIKYCPHGRPITVEITATQLEKMFGRIQ